jgi:hypothetical protein
VSDVAARLDRIWRDACDSRDEAWFRQVESRLAAEVVAILAEHGIVPSDGQTRTLRWLCGWEIQTVINVVELMVAGRDVKEQQS